MRGAWRVAQGFDFADRSHKKGAPRPCDFCKGGYDAAESVRFGFDLCHSSILREGEKPVSEFGFNCSRFMRLWYPPLRRTQGWGTHGCGEFTVQKAGHPSPRSSPGFQECARSLRCCRGEYA
jgi:hypothetical protein